MDHADGIFGFVLEMLKIGHLSILLVAIENECEWWNEITCLEITCSAAAEGWHLACLQSAIDKGCRWDRYWYKGAQSCRDSEVLRYVIDQGCPRDFE